MSEFIYQKPFPVTKDTTKYRLLSKDFVSTIEVDGRKILKLLFKDGEINIIEHASTKFFAFEMSLKSQPILAISQPFFIFGYHQPKKDNKKSRGSPPTLLF